MGPRWKPLEAPQDLTARHSLAARQGPVSVPSMRATRIALPVQVAAHFAYIGTQRVDLATQALSLALDLAARAALRTAPPAVIQDRARPPES